jgi:hypothetical protein
VITQAAAFTVGAGYTFYAYGPSLGAGSAITSQFGVFVVNQGVAGVANAYGIYIQAQSGAATTNIALWNNGTTQLQGTVGLGTTPVPQVGVYMLATLTGATTESGLNIQPLFDANATTQGSVFLGALRTVASSYAMTSGIVVNIASPSVGAGSTVTNLYGINVANQGALGVTNAYGINIQAQSGASGNNIGLYNAGTTQIQSYVGIGGAPNTSGSDLLKVYQNMAVVGTLGLGSAGSVGGVALSIGGSNYNHGMWSTASVAAGGDGWEIDQMRVGGVPASNAHINIDYRSFYIEPLNVPAGFAYNYGLYIGAPGGATNNIGLYNGGPSTLVGTLSLGSNSPPIALRPLGGTLSIEAQAGSLFLSGGTQAAALGNAYFDGTNYQRWNVGSAASLIQAGIGNMVVYTAPAGANPISWTNCLSISASVASFNVPLTAPSVLGLVSTGSAGGNIACSGGTWQNIVTITVTAGTWYFFFRVVAQYNSGAGIAYMRILDQNNNEMDRTFMTMVSGQPAYTSLDGFSLLASVPAGAVTLQGMGDNTLSWTTVYNRLIGIRMT